MEPALVVGLRNPGERYEATRHNLGGDVARVVASRHNSVFQRVKRRPIDVADVRVGVVHGRLVLPQVFMNESGRSVGSAIRYFKPDRDRVLVIHDDIDLPFAKMRVQWGGGHGGNNGIRSTIRSLRSPDFWRLKLGVGRPHGRMDPAAYVLQPFRSEERDEIAVLREKAGDVVEIFIERGGEAARQIAGDLNT